MQECERGAAERGPYLRADDEIEQLVPIGFRGMRCIEAQRLRGALKLAYIGRERIESCVSMHRVAITHEFHRPLRSQQMVRKVGDFSHELFERKPEAIPLEQREFGVVLPAALD